MKAFFGEEVLLSTATAKRLYAQVKELPIVDYHCHLDVKKIKSDARFSDLGELWLAGDHYKWRAMRLNGVDEHYITGDASYKEKFLKYAQIMPALIGNPLYYWTHLELRQLFQIETPLNGDTAEIIYRKANEGLKTLSVSKLLKFFNVEFVATTDDPADGLEAHGVYGNTRVTPTFRPDKLYAPDAEYLKGLGDAAGIAIRTLGDLLCAVRRRLDFFVEKGCRMSDHGFEKFPRHYATPQEAAALFERREHWSAEDQDAFFGFLLTWLAEEYARRNVVMQLHFGVIRNCNTQMLARCGADSGFDLIGEVQPVKDVVKFFDRISDDARPQTLLYPLNDANLPALAAVTGAFRKVRMGAAWWFNDTAEGIGRNLSVISEYSSLGNSPGMLTDSRSFSSYSRFDFFRRIFCDFVAEKVEKGEYGEGAAQTLVQNVCYYNAKNMTEGRG